jgi:hypothetical protein
MTDTTKLTVAMLDEIIAVCAIADRQTFNSKDLLPILDAARLGVDIEKRAAALGYDPDDKSPEAWISLQAVNQSLQNELARGGWRDIETAPKRGKFLACTEEYDLVEVLSGPSTVGGKLMFLNHNSGNYTEVKHWTHWQPIPEPPKSETEKEVMPSGHAKLYPSVAQPSQEASQAPVAASRKPKDIPGTRMMTPAEAVERGFIGDGGPAAGGETHWHSEEDIAGAVYGYMQALRSLNRTRVNTSEIAAALDLTQQEVAKAVTGFEMEGVKPSPPAQSQGDEDRYLSKVEQEAMNAALLKSGVNKRAIPSPAVPMQGLAGRLHELAQDFQENDPTTGEAYDKDGRTIIEAVLALKQAERLLTWCRARLSKDCYRTTLDDMRANPRELDETPVVQSPAVPMQGLVAQLLAAEKYLFDRYDVDGTINDTIKEAATTLEQAEREIAEYDSANKDIMEAKNYFVKVHAEAQATIEQLRRDLDRASENEAENGIAWGKAQAEIASLKGALEWLVELKDVTKKQSPKLYEANKEHAWELARSALTPKGAMNKQQAKKLTERMSDWPEWWVLTTGRDGRVWCPLSSVERDAKILACEPRYPR